MSVGLNSKFHAFIPPRHRFSRFTQEREVNLHVIYTENEDHVWKKLQEKWRKHIELQTEMINIVREYGLNTEKIKTDMKRQMFGKRRVVNIGDHTLYNDDTVKVHEDMESNSVDMILTSIPFGDHYEYSDNYNDMGHNDGNEEFFKQMDFLTPNLLRVLKHGRIAAIHVKDRIRYSYQNGTKFTTIDDFTADTSAHFRKHGFYLMGKITVTTDVVRENNQTYRLGWSEQCKDASKMGVGLPEYILLFRKKPSHMDNAYADDPITKTKEDYTRANWQLDAHSLWKSDGNRFLSSEELQKRDLKFICNHWKKHNLEEVYNFKEHLSVCEELESFNKLSSLFMTLPNHSNNEFVWTDINRMNTLNTNQANRKKQKHICPLQLDIIERLINRFSNKGEVVDDPFGGLFSTSYKSAMMGRRSISTELNSSYFEDGLFYMKSIEYKMNVPTLFDLLD
jgi:DNA modification methylase